MDVDKFEVKFGVAMVVVVAIVATMVVVLGVHIGWSASEKAAAYRAYTECLRVMQTQPIDVQQSFCGKIRDQL